MDFVDLDKVLDQFEEEEKAAEEILPGREIKPSGYAEYLVSHQDRPWESLSLGQALETNSKQLLLHPQTVLYDDPYDSCEKSKLEDHSTLKQLAFPNKPGHVDYQVIQDADTRGQSLSLEEELAQSKLKEEKIEAYLPPLHLSNGLGQGTGLDLNGWGGEVKGEEGERRGGLIASQPASIQTDSLSPASEQELLSYPLPKSDILVEGHDQPHSNAQSLAHCQSEDMEPAPNYAPSNDNGVTAASTEQHVQDTHDDGDNEHQVNTDVDSEHPTGVSEENAVDASDAGTCPCAGEDGDVAISKTPAPVSGDLKLSEKLPEMRGADNTLEQGRASVEGHEDQVIQLAVGFDTGECDMDKDEVDAYLEELESSMLADGSDRSEPTAFCDKSKMTLAVNDGGDVPGHTANGEVQKTAFAAVSAEGDHLGPEMRETTAAVIHSAADGVDNSQGRVESSQHTIADDVADGDRGGNSQGTVESSQQSTAEDIADGDEGDNTDVSVNSHEDSGESKLQGQITQHYANIEDMGMLSESTGVHVIRDDHTNFQHPYLEAEIVDRPDALFRKDQQIECGMETDETEAVTTTEVKADRSADKTPPGLSIVNKPEAKSDVNLKRLVDTTSLEFPVAGNKNGVSSVVKGKLEIEGLLDEIVAARLAQKSSEVSSAEHAPIGQLTVEQAVLKDGDGGEKSRSEGWGPEGSMVCSRVREPSSPEMTSPAQSGSPSPTLGIGARPKDPSQMKKNRPNSLLGLSKISLASPFSPSQQATGPVIEVMLPSTHQGSTGSEVTDRESRTQSHSVGGRPLGVSPPTVGAPPPEGGAVLPMDGSPAPSAMENLADDCMDSPVMRRPDMRGDAGMAGEGEEASNGVVRPQSWSPSTMSSPPTQRTKRPTSLNLPVRQDRMGSLSPDGDNNGTRKTGLVVESGGSSEAGSSEEESVGIGGTDGGTYQDIRSQDPNPEQEGAGAAAEMPMETPPPSILHLNLGKIAPTWLPDADATSCMECAARFTFTKRRHHCRACGKIFCSTCCGQKSRLTYLENKEGRVCISCYHILSSAHCVRPAGVSCRSPNPNNPIEYCSTVPPTQQANARAPLPTVMVPTGVLKRHGSNRKSEPKQVMFSDGIRPGGDLTELDGSDQARLPPRRSGRAQKKVEKQQGDHSSAKTRRLRGNDGLRNPCLIPDQGLPPVVVHTDDKGEVTLSENPDPASFMAQIRNEEAAPVVFAINLNLFVQVKIINLDCCLKRVVWCFTTEGMVTVGQEELVVVLETLPEEDTVPRDIFCHFSTVYEEAGKGNPVSHMGHSIFNQPFLDSSSHGGFLYLRSTFQCTNKLLLPPPPFLFPILLHKWESPWAKVFPIRLMLRLGAEHRYYPCPLVSIRNRKPVFFEIGHTIMNLLADFRNFQYMLQQIRGVSIHMEDQKTFINFPRNRYQDVMKVVSSSNEHVMALGASFSLEADSHLVCIQNEDGNYQTQAINIQNKPRQVTGASFVVFNGALKSSAGLRAKSSIVEDGLMVQILPEMMGALKQSLKDMKDFTIPCGSLALPQPEEVVTVRWVDDDKKVNVGVKSPVDGLSLEGVESVQVHKATDYVGERYAIRWTQLFFLQTESGTSRWEPLDLNRVAETLANAVCIALTPHLMKLKEAALTKIGLRVTLQPDSVGYEVGSNGERLPDFYINDLDNALIPVIHSAITTNQEGPIVLELHLYLIH